MEERKQEENRPDRQKQPQHVERPMARPERERQPEDEERDNTVGKVPESEEKPEEKRDEA
jgi:hypothetical protein